MKRKIQLALVALTLSRAIAFAGEPGDSAPPRHISLHEAIELALKHNHNVRIAAYKVEEQQHTKEVAKSAYFPTIRNDSNFVHLTDTQLIQIYAGSLGTVAGSPIPAANAIINQGGRNLTTSGTQLTQPLTTILKIKPANDMAQAELKASRERAQQTQNDVALRVHLLYYKVLIAQVHRTATEARIKASQDLQKRTGGAGEVRQHAGRAADRKPRPSAGGKTGTADHRAAALRSYIAAQRCHGAAAHDHAGARSQHGGVPGNLPARNLRDSCPPIASRDHRSA